MCNDYVERLYGCLGYQRDGGDGWVMGKEYGGSGSGSG